MTTECETKEEKPSQKIERKLDRTQVAMFVFGMVAAFFGGIFVEARGGLVSASSAATYDQTARNDATQALRKADEANEAVSILEKRVNNLQDEFRQHMRRIGVPSGAPTLVPQREGQ